MSDLSNVEEMLEKDCLCHDSDLNFMFECMPPYISVPNFNKECKCFHKHEKNVKEALKEFKTFLTTKAKFKVGDRVELALTPDINYQDSWGWMPSRHFLIKGSKATVQDVSYYKNEFGYALVFDDETGWIDEKNVIHPYEHPAGKKHCFYFKETSVTSTRSVCDFLKTLWYDFYTNKGD